MSKGSFCKGSQLTVVFCNNKRNYREKTNSFSIDVINADAMPAVSKMQTKLYRTNITFLIQKIKDTEDNLTD